MWRREGAVLIVNCGNLTAIRNDDTGMALGGGLQNMFRDRNTSDASQVLNTSRPGCCVQVAILQLPPGQRDLMKDTAGAHQSIESDPFGNSLVGFLKSP